MLKELAYQPPSHAFDAVARGAIDSMSGVFGTTPRTGCVFAISRLRAGNPASPQSVPSSVLLNFFMPMAFPQSLWNTAGDEPKPAGGKETEDPSQLRLRSAPRLLRDRRIPRPDGHQNLIGRIITSCWLRGSRAGMRLIETKLWERHRARVRALLGPWCVSAATLHGAALLAWLAMRVPALAQDNVVATATLPRDLSPWGMYLNADPVVKAVLIGLALASIVTWTVWLAKTIEIVLAKRRVRGALNKLIRVRSTAEGVERLADAQGEVMQFLEAAVTELKVSTGSTDREGIKERIASRLERIEASHGRRILRGTGVLATIGATAPFVGLFGTVWGIMNSFIGISKSHTTNLAVVAPGIAEALLATAFGLAAAIPAVVIYNVFARSIAGYRAGLGDAAAEVLRLVSRDLERVAVAPPSPARRATPLSAVE